MMVSIEIYHWSKSRESVSVDFSATIETYISHSSPRLGWHHEREGIKIVKDKS